MRQVCFLFAAVAFAQAPTFQTNTTLQSIAVRVTDARGVDVKGLTAEDFTLLEDKKAQKIAFFGAENQPISLAVLIDASASMRAGGKFARAVSMLAPLLRGNHPDDEIFFVPFTDRAAGFTQLSAAQRLEPPKIEASGHESTALYDALASALCQLRGARNARQAVVVLTDGADQNSRLKLEELVQFAASSNAQVFIIGFFENTEAALFHQGAKTVTLVGERQIDNPVVVFNRLAKQSGAAAFFPASERDLKETLERISALIKAEYTLAYYPQDPDRARKIEVKTSRGGLRVESRATVGAGASDGPVHFVAASCEVSAKEHPHPWELRASLSPSGALVYHEDFSDAQTGWPRRPEENPRTQHRAGLRYVNRGYEISRSSLAMTAGAEGVVIAYGPFWENFRASVLIDSNLMSRGIGFYATAPALIFHLGAEGYYAVQISGARHAGANETAVQLIKKKFSDRSETVLLPWTYFADAGTDSEKRLRKLSASYRDGRIGIFLEDHEVAHFQDSSFPSGLAGLGLFGYGRAVFHELIVEELQ